jgi:DNA adenine methylase
MRYMGGKTRTAKKIALSITEHSPYCNGIYIEPFMGGASVSAAVAATDKFKHLLLSDIDPNLILLWTAGLDGWIPPDSMSRQEYMELKSSEDSALRGWACYAASHSGKPWGGYGTTASGRNYLEESVRLFRKRCESLNSANVKLQQIDYRELNYPDKSIIYADPPYHNTEIYRGEKFNSKEFWMRMRELSKRCFVFVSEYLAPEDWLPIWTTERKATIDPYISRPNLERLYMCRDGLPPHSTPTRP